MHTKQESCVKLSVRTGYGPGWKTETRAQARLKDRDQGTGKAGRQTSLAAAASSANKSALSWLEKDLVCTRKSRRWSLKAVLSCSSKIPATHACTDSQRNEELPCKEKKPKTAAFGDAFWHQLNEKPSTIPGCPGVIAALQV